MDKINDKRCRFESHKAYLKKCLENDVVPDGLRVWVEPSIGNRDEQFLARWHARCEEFSKILATDVIEFCGTTVEMAKTEYMEASNHLKAMVTEKESGISRKRSLSTRKADEMSSNNKKTASFTD